MPRHFDFTPTQVEAWRETIRGVTCYLVEFDVDKDMQQTGYDGREWSHDGENILSPKNLAAVEHHLEKIGAIVVEHWHYYGGSAPTRLAFDGFDDFKGYLDSSVKPGDAVDVWPFPTDVAKAIACAKYPDAEGRVPIGGAY